jgi:hypothetical protein
VLRFHLSGVLCALALASVAGCGDAGNQGDSDLSGGLPDGFVNTACKTADDCAPTLCQTAKCNPVTKSCEYKNKFCADEGACSAGACDESTGDCVQRPANDGMACTLESGAPGVCGGSTCQTVPTCSPSGKDALDWAMCDQADSSVSQGTNAMMSWGGGAPVIGAYPCAPNEAGPEHAYYFYHDGAVDEDVTVTLRPVEADGKPAKNDDKDLDLIVIEGACTGSAACMNPKLDGNLYQGVTPGTAQERVRFRALAGKDYYIVVDGKDLDQVKDYVIEIEACGKCQPSAGTRLDCNMTMPISTSTAMGASELTDYACGEAKTAKAAAGKEIPFYFRTNDGAVRNVTATVTGGSGEKYTLLALPTNSSGQCDPTSCLGFKDSVSGAASLTWKVDPSWSSFARYWAVVDTDAADATFGLQLACDPYCLAPYEMMCGDSGNELNVVLNGTTSDGSTTLSTQYGPGAACNGLTGLTGPETAIKFTPTLIGTPASYKLTLKSKTAGRPLSMTILDAGTSGASCNPKLACHPNTLTAASTTYTGTRTTSDTKSAGISFTAEPDHVYYILVDGTAAGGGNFDLKIVGQGGGAGCP